MIKITWGELPSKVEFMNEFNVIYSFDGCLEIDDAFLPLPDGVKMGEYDPDRLYGMLEEMVADVLLNGEFDPGNLKEKFVENVLGVLGFEWV